MNTLINTKRIMTALLFALLLGMISGASAQEIEAAYEAACERGDFEDKIDAAWAEYQDTRSIDQDTDGALASVIALQAIIEAEVTACLEAQQDARRDDLAVLLDEMQSGGTILYVRHTHTDRVGSGDTDRAGCATERNLSTRGREEALAIGDSYAQLNLPVSTLITTELCRVRDTIELAFGEPTQIIQRSELEVTLADLLTVEPEAGTNTIIVAHIGTINRNFGLPIPFEEGDTYVFRPMGDGGFTLIGRIGLLDWSLLVELNDAD